MSPVSIPSSSFKWYYQNRIPGSPVRERLLVSASVGGGPPHVFQVDTGSCGLVIGRANVGAPFDKPNPDLPSSPMHYMPSGVVLTGQWTPGVPVALLNPDGAPQEPGATATATVLIVDEPACFNGGMLGVGYQGDYASHNPLMDVSLGGTQLSAGYVIGQDYLEVGLTAENQAGFGFAPLQPGTKPGEWVGPTASVTLSGPLFSQPVALELPLLMDTGVDLMMLFASTTGLPAAWAHANPSANVIVDTAQVGIAVTVPATGTPLVSYAFGDGKTAHEAPEQVLYMGPGGGINTGINVLRTHDYLFDGSGQRIGFRPRPPA